VCVWVCVRVYHFKITRHPNCVCLCVCELIKRTPPSRGGFLFTMFPDQEPCVRDFTTRCDSRISWAETQTTCVPKTMTETTYLFARDNFKRPIKKRRTKKCGYVLNLYFNTEHSVFQNLDVRLQTKRGFIDFFGKICAMVAQCSCCREMQWERASERESANTRNTRVHL